MTVGELKEKLDLEVISEGAFSKTIDGCYCSDLLSHCMSNINEKNVWITVQANINIVAIAVLTELSCIIIAQDMNIEKNVIDKAVSEQVTVFRSNKTAYELCVNIGKLI